MKNPASPQPEDTRQQPKHKDGSGQYKAPPASQPAPPAPAKKSHFIKGNGQPA